jgi:hypothetical protein
MDEYKQHLRRLAVHDDALLDALAVEGGACTTSAIDEKTAALVRVAATIAVDAAPHSFQHAIALALAAGGTSDEIVASLEAVTPVTEGCAGRPVRPEGRTRARLRRRRGARERDP